MSRLSFALTTNSSNNSNTTECNAHEDIRFFPHLFPGLSRDASAVQGCVTRRLVFGVHVYSRLPREEICHGLVAVLARKEEGSAVILRKTIKRGGDNRSRERRGAAGG